MPKRKTIRDIWLAGASEECEICGASLTELQKGEDYQQYVHTCSEKCFRKWAGKTWPKEQDCPCCPSHIGGPHKFSCAYGGVRQIKIPVILDNRKDDE